MASSRRSDPVAQPAPAKALWACPQCGRHFAARNTQHSCGQYSIEAHFAGRDPLVHQVYEQLLETLRGVRAGQRLCPEVAHRVPGRDAVRGRHAAPALVGGATCGCGGARPTWRSGAWRCKSSATTDTFFGWPGRRTWTASWLRCCTKPMRWGSGALAGRP